MSFAKNSEFRHLFHFIEYNDIVAKPEEVLNDLYDFLEVPRFDGHTFTDLVSEVPRESITGVVELHHVNPVLERKSVSPEEIFLPETVKRYSDMEFWRDL
jgi:hypothetical protein